MEFKLNALIASVVSIPCTGNSITSSHLNFTTPSSSSSSSTPFRTYAIPKLHPHRNDTNNRRFTHKGNPIGNPSVEPKFKLNQSGHQNKNVNLVGLCQEGKLNQVLELMGQGVVANYNVYLLLLKLCEDLKELESGKRVHEFLRRSSYRGDVELSNRLIWMYMKCGSIKNARKVFDKMSERNISSWHLLISGYTLNGLGDDDLLAFKQMKEQGIAFDGETFELVLAACARVEAVEEGFMHFESMKEYGIVPGLKHYLGVVIQ